MSVRGERAAAYARLRGPYLEAHPWCEIQWDTRCTVFATEVDHWIDRSLRPDLVADPANFRAACSHCHRQKTLKVGEAFDRGLKGQSWQEPEPMPEPDTKPFAL